MLPGPTKCVIVHISSVKRWFDEIPCPRAVGLMIEVISVLILRAYMPTSNVGLSLTWSQDQSVSSAVCGRPVVDV